MAAPLSLYEEERLEVLRQCEMLDTQPDAIFDDITRLAAHICGVPISAVSLIDKHRQWFKSVVGMNTRETAREMAFCAHTILQSGIMTVPDAQADARFADNALVTGEPHIRFYAGAPLVTSDGYALGSLCVIDRTPRTLTPEQETALRLLAGLAAGHLETARRLAAQERLIAERAAAEAERKRLADIVESSGDAIVSVDLERRFVSWNRGAERLFGYTAAEMLGQPSSRLVPPGGTDYPADISDTLIAQERIAGLEVVRQKKDGTHVDINVTLSLLRDAYGRPIGVSAVGRDITERRRMEAALEAERQFQQALLESLQEGIVACDGDGTLRLFNGAARAFHNASEEPLPADQWAQSYDLYQADGQTPMPTGDIPLFRALQGEIVREAEMVIVPQGGAARIVHASGKAIYDSHGEKLGAVVAMHDVTERMQAERALRLGEARLTEAQSLAHLGHWNYDIATGRIVWSDELFRLFGLDPAQDAPTVEELMTYYHPDDVPMHREIVAQATQDGLPYEFDIRILRRDGETRWAHAIGRGERGPAGEVVRLVGTLMDIHDRKGGEEALRQSEVRLRTVMENAPIVLFATDTDGIITMSEGAGLERLGLKPGQVVGQSVFEMYADYASIRDNMRRALAGETVSYDVEISGMWFHSVLRPQRDRDGAITGLIGVGHDMTERKQAEETLKDFFVVLEFQKGELEKVNAELASLATIDGLTGLRNRRAFDERLAEEFERSTRYQKSLSLMLLDIDYFKEFNDKFGHPAGDEVLRQIGHILHKTTRDMDYLARYGGEEIAIILPETDAAGAMRLAERVREAIACAPWSQRAVTASIGVCTLQIGMARPDEMVAWADLALYQSKAEGRNCVTFSGGSIELATAAHELPRPG